MPVYAIALLTITDPARYERYVSRFMGVFERFRGRLLAADESPAVVEGAWNGSKAVLLEFPDEVSFREWLESPDYQEIVKDRHASSSAVILLAKGIS